MKRRGDIIKPPRGREVLPHVADRPEENIYFFPFIAASGFSDLAKSIEANSQKINAVVNGKAPVILKWLGAQQSVSWAKEDSEQVTADTKFKRNFRIGEYFHGVILRSEYSHLFVEKNTGFKTIQGNNLNLVESTDERNITIVTDTDFFSNQNTRIKSDVSPDLARLFFICPELAPNDVLFISNMNTIHDRTQNIKHYEITFSSIKNNLEKVGAALRSFIQFGAPGQGYPYPYVEEDQPENETLFFDDLAESKVNTKRIYIDRNRIKDQGVDNFTLEFDGAALISSIQFLGRPVIEPTDEEEAKAYYKLDRIRPLFVNEFYGENENAKNNYVADEINQFQLLHGVVVSENWYDSNRQAGLDELGLWFDPAKAKASQLVLQCIYSNSKISFSGKSLTPRSTLTGTGGWLFARWQNRWNKYSTYTLDPTLQEDKSISVNGIDYATGIRTISEALNTNTMYQWGVSALEPGGVKTTNRKGVLRGHITQISGTAGALAGGLVGFVTGGVTAGAFLTFVGSQVGNIAGQIMDWMPDKWFTDQEIYRPASLTTFLAPKRLLEDFAHKIADYVEKRDDHKIPVFQQYDSKRIPLEFFTEEANNYLSSLVSGGTYKIKLSHGITNKFKLGDATEEHDTLKLLNGDNGYQGNGAFYRDQIIKTESNGGTNFIIDGFILKAVTRFPMRLVFYNSEGRQVWESVRMTDAGYYGNILDWESFVPLSDVQDDGQLWNDPNHKYPRFIVKNPQTNDATAVEAAKEAARSSIVRAHSFNLGVRAASPGAEYEANESYWKYEPGVRDNAYNHISDNWRWRKSAGNYAASAYSFAYRYRNYPSDVSQRKIYNMYPHRLYLPKTLQDDLIKIHGDAANTRRKRWELLRTEYNFKTIRILKDAPSVDIGYYCSGVDSRSHRPAWRDTFTNKYPPGYRTGPLPDPFTLEKVYSLENIPQTADPRTSNLEFPGNRGIGNRKSWNEERQFRIGYYAIALTTVWSSWTTGWWRWGMLDDGTYQIPPFVCWWQTDSIDTGAAGQSLQEQSMYVGWDLHKHPSRVICKFNNNFEGAGGGTNGPAWAVNWHLSYEVDREPGSVVISK